MSDRAALDLPSSQESLGLSDVSETELERLTKDLRENPYSSGGELSDIARQVSHNPSTTEEWVIKGQDSHMEPLTQSYFSDMERKPEQQSEIWTNAATGHNPSNKDWSGTYNFQLRIKDAKRSKDPHFSSVMNKLYLNQNQGVEIFFRVDPSQDIDEIFIRGIVVFTKADDFREPVKVCPTHSLNNGGLLVKEFGDHLMRTSDDSKTKYGTDPVSGRNFLLVPYPDVQPGSDEVSIVFKFTDLGSCPGGVNRRDTAIIFTLENRTEVLGRLVLPVRICTSPRRDLRTEEEQEHQRQGCNSVQMVNLQVPVIKTERGSELKFHATTVQQPKRQYWVLANGEENFDALCKMAEVLEKKDNGDIKKWRNEVISRNGLIKKPKFDSFHTQD